MAKKKKNSSAKKKVKKQYSKQPVAKQSKKTGSKRKSKSGAKRLRSIQNAYQGHLAIVLPVFASTDQHQLAQEIRQFAQLWQPAHSYYLVNASGEAGLEGQLAKALEGLADERVSLHFIEQESTARGKAIKAAMPQIESEHVLLADGHLGTSLHELGKWVHQAPNHSLPDDSIWLGSRMEKDAQAEQGNGSLLPTFFYNLGVQLFTSLNLKDSQAHFMLMPTTVAKELYASSPTASDAEILYHADLHQLDIEEKSIQWEQPEEYNQGFGEFFKKGFGLFYLRWITRLFFFFVRPFKELKLSKEHPLRQGESPIFRFAFAAGSILLFFIMCMMSFDYGISGDEVIQRKYGDTVLKYFESNGKDQSFMDLSNLRYYGGLFDYLTAWLHQYFSNWDLYNLRHFINSIFGFVAILFAARIGRQVSGSWRVGLLTLVLLALSPRFLGHSMNNPKDIPFTMGYLITIHYLLLMCKQLPRPNIKSILMVILGVGITINVRAGGIILIPYIGLFLAATVLVKKDLRSIVTKFKLGIIAKLALIFGLIVLLGYWVGTWYWPYAQLDIVKNPFVALDEMTKFSVGIRMLWNGEHVWSDQLPWYYIPQWLIISSPLVVLFGAPLVGGLFFHRKHRTKWLWIALLLFTSLFPVVYAIYKKSSLYDGMRHFLFVYPGLVIAAAFGWVILADLFRNKITNIIISVVIAGLLYFPLSWTIYSHPYQYIYFNELFGGVKAAYGKYETDYYMNSMRQLSKWVIENEPKVKAGEKLYITTNCYEPVKHYFQDYPNVKVSYTRYDQRAKVPYDYYLSFSRFISQGFIESEVWPPGNVVHVEKVGGIPIGAVTKTTDSNENGYKGWNALKDNKIEEGIQRLEKVVAEDPKNESALILLSQYYPRLSTPDKFTKMKGVLDQLNTYADDYVNGLGMMGVYYFNTRQLDSSAYYFEKAVDLNYKYTFGYYYLANIVLQQNNDLNRALEYMIKFDEWGGKPQNGYALAEQIAQKADNRKYYLYFNAKNLATKGKHREAYQKVSQALGVDPDFKAAIKMKESYEKAAEEQKRKEAQKRNSIK